MVSASKSVEVIKTGASRIGIPRSGGAVVYLQRERRCSTTVLYALSVGALATDDNARRLEQNSKVHLQAPVLHVKSIHRHVLIE